MSIYNNRINAVSAPCGTGKTYATCKYIQHHQIENNWLYVAPTKKLLEQTQGQLKGFGVPAVAIHSDNTNNTKKVIIDHLKECSSMGNVLLITWAAYSELPYFHKRENWQVFIDEVPQIDQFYQYYLDDDVHKEELFKHLRVEHSVNENIGIIKARGSLKNHIEKNQDDIDQTFRKLFHDVVNSNKDVFVDMNSFYSGDKFWFLSMVNHNVFKNTTLLGANIEHSILYSWFKYYHGVEFQPHTKITNGLLDSSPVGERLRISYFSKKKFSKKLRDKQLKNDAIVMDAIEKGVSKIVGDERFLLVANNDYKGPLLALPNVKQIPVDSKGMNEYQDYSTIVHLTALNREPKHQRMLNQLGIDDSTIRQSTGYEVLYQNIMRTALRDKDSKQIVNVICADIGEAKHLSRLFGEVQIKRVGDLEFKKYVPLTTGQRKQRNNYKKVKEQLVPVGDREIPRIGYETCKKDNLYKKSTLYDAYLTNPANTSSSPTEYGYSLTFHGTHKDFDSIKFHEEFFGAQDFFWLLENSASTVINSKDELYLVCPSTFIPQTTNTYRTYDNLQETSMMILDFDNGTLSIDDFENIFWKQAGRGQKRSFAICNSFSRSPEEPNNFRVFMPFKTPVGSIAAYQAVYDSIVQRLEQNGFVYDPTGLDPNHCGLDPQSRTPNQSYWMPCTNRAYPEWAYFNKLGYTTRELERCSIDPDGYIKTAMKPVTKIMVAPLKREPSGEPVSDERNEQILNNIEEIKTEYRAVPKGQHKRNHAFYMTALKLSNYMSSNEVEHHLQELASGEKKMVNRIKWAMDSLKKKVA